MESIKNAKTDDIEPILAMACVNMQPFDSVYEAEQSYSNGTLFPALNKPFWKETEGV